MKTKKKRKLKIPAALYGLTTALNDPYVGTDYAANLIANNGAQTRLDTFTAGMVNRDVDAATNFNDSLNKLYGNTMSKYVDQISEKENLVGGGSGIGSKAAGIAGALPGAIDTVTGLFQKSTATTGGEAAMQSVMDIGKGAASGALLGLAIGGPIGGVVGAIGGAAVGMIGKKGKKADMTSFTDYDEGTLSTGLRGFGNRKLRKIRKQIATNANLNRDAVAGTERLANEFNENNTEVNTNTFEYGGLIPESLAYVDDGEVLSTPDGQISKVPEQGNPTDSNLVNLPEGTRILSNTLKVPGTKMTFAELGNKMMAKRKSKGKDIYALNADMLNNLNNLEIHDKLFAMQENLKAKKGIKPKSKSINRFAIGGESDKQDAYYILGRKYTSKGKGDVIIPWLNYGEGVQTSAASYTPYSNTVSSTTVKTKPTTKTTALPEDYVDEPDLLSRVPKVDINYPEYQPTSYTKPNIKLMTPKEIENQINGIEGLNKLPKERTPFDWQGLATDLTALSPILSNLFTSAPEKVLTNYNPYATAIANTMSRRRYNIDPLLNDIDANRAAADYAMSQQMTNTGLNMAFRLQNAIQTNKAKANARIAESNANNAYKAEYANAMDNLGRQWVSATNLSDDLNARNRAQTRNIRRVGLGQLSQLAQTKQLARNQKSRDDAMMKLYSPFLQAGFTASDLEQFKKYLRIGGNK